MIKLQDFARQMGVTDRAVQKLLKKYEAELSGTFERKGPNGTWLTDEACEILRGKMKQQPVTVFEEDPRVGQLQERVADLEHRLDEKDKLLAIANQQVQDSQDKVAQLQETNAKVALLEAGNKAAEARAADLEGRLEAERQATQGANERADRAEQACRDLDDRRQSELKDLTDRHQSELRDLAGQHKEEIDGKDNEIRVSEDARKAVEASLKAVLVKEDEIDQAPFWRRPKLKRELCELREQLEKEMCLK